MKIERTKNATKGIIVGLILKLHQMVIPFIMRTVMLYYLGVQYLGLNSLFASVLQVLNLAELGVGSAMVFSMYKPISDDNTEEICALMRLYKLYYRIIGVVIAVVGLIILPFIPYLIRSDVPNDINVYILYLLNLFSTVLTYWLFAYKNCILQAHQRVDIISLITIIVNTIQYALQIVVVIIFRNYYLYVVMLIICQVINNISTAITVTRMFPDYKAKGKLEKEKVTEINLRIKDLFTSKIGSVVLNSADSIVISAFLGLTALAIYQNYFYLISSIIALVQIGFASIMAGLGNSFITDTKEKVFSDLKKFTFIFQWIIGFCTVCFLCLFQPFMKIWVGEKLMLGMSAVVFFCIYYYFYEVNRLLNVYKDAAGLWHEDRFRPLTAALVNLFLNVLLINVWGLYGVILSTVIAILFVEMPWLLHNLFTVFFEHNRLNEYLKRLIYYFIVTVGAAIITYLLCSLVTIDGKWQVLVVRLMICVIVPNIIFLFFYHSIEEFKSSNQLVQKMISIINFIPQKKR